VVEPVQSWFNACRAILVRWERRTDLHLAAIKVASILLGTAVCTASGF